jgi:hypothetical protein
MINAARTAFGKPEKSGARMRSVRRTVMPDVRDAKLVRAPERSLRALADRLVDTGMPWNRETRPRSSRPVNG